MECYVAQMQHMREQYGQLRQLLEMAEAKAEARRSSVAKADDKPRRMVAMQLGSTDTTETTGCDDQSSPHGQRRRKSSSKTPSLTSPSEGMSSEGKRSASIGNGSASSRGLPSRSDSWDKYDYDVHKKKTKGPSEPFSPHSPQNAEAGSADAGSVGGRMNRVPISFRRSSEPDSDQDIADPDSKPQDGSDLDGLPLLELEKKLLALEQKVAQRERERQEANGQIVQKGDITEEEARSRASMVDQALHKGKPKVILDYLEHPQGVTEERIKHVVLCVMAEKIQRTWRMQRAYHEMLCIIVTREMNHTVQKCWGQIAQRSRLQSLIRLQNHRAERLRAQRHRNWLNFAAFGKHYDERVGCHAVTFLQAAWRGFVIRRRVFPARIAQSIAGMRAARGQRSAEETRRLRRFSQQTTDLAMKALRHLASVKIQALWRSFKARKRIMKICVLMGTRPLLKRCIRKLKTHALLKIYVRLRNVKISRLKAKRDKLHPFFDFVKRGQIDRKIARRYDDKKHRKRASIILQAWARGCLARINVKPHIFACRIQAHWRKILSWRRTKQIQANLDVGEVLEHPKLSRLLGRQVGWEAQAVLALKAAHARGPGERMRRTISLRDTGCIGGPAKRLLFTLLAVRIQSHWRAAVTRLFALRLFAQVYVSGKVIDVWNQNVSIRARNKVFIRLRLRRIATLKEDLEISRRNGLRKDKCDAKAKVIMYHQNNLRHRNRSVTVLQTWWRNRDFHRRIQSKRHVTDADSADAD